MNEDNQFKPKRKKTGGRVKGSTNHNTYFKNLLVELEKREFDLYNEWIIAIQANNVDKANAIARLLPIVSKKDVQKTFSESDIAIEQNRLNMVKAQKLFKEALLNNDNPKSTGIDRS